MKRYCIEIGEENEETKTVNVNLNGSLFAVDTYFKGKRTSTIRINPHMKKEGFQFDSEFIEMHKALKSLLFQMHNEEDN